MRTTLTLDPDVAALLKQEARRQKGSLKEAVNTALRAGLQALNAPPVAPLKSYAITPWNLGPSLIGSLDDIEEVLSRVEGEDHK